MYTHSHSLSVVNSIRVAIADQWFNALHYALPTDPMLPLLKLYLQDALAELTAEELICYSTHYHNNFN